MPKLETFQTIESIDFSRRTSLEFYSKMEDPWVGFTVMVDVGPLFLGDLGSRKPFGMLLMHLFARAINRSEPMRLRIHDPKTRTLRLYDTISISSTFLVEGTVLFVDNPYYPDFDDFVTGVEEARKKAKTDYEKNKLSDSPVGDRSIQSTVFFSIVPWIHFTSLQNPKFLGENAGSVPTIVVGKAKPNGDRVDLPVYVQVHHGLMDGLQLGEFFSILDQEITQTKKS